MKAHESRQRSLIMLALFIVSGTGLAFEITLTRIFSLFFQYHFAFLAVSLAVLGLSLGAAWGHFRTRNQTRTLVLVLIALGIAFPVVTAILSWYPSAGSVVPRALVALIPFILIGLFAALTFAQFSSASGLLYGADLAGAGIGVLIVLGLLSVLSAFSVVLVLGVLVSGVVLAFVLGSADLRADRRLVGAAVLAGGAGIVLLVANLISGVVDFDPDHLRSAPRDKTMLLILDDPTQDARIVRTAWSPFARVDVVETRDPTSKYIFSDGGAGSFMLRYDGQLSSVQDWQQTIDYLPFAAGPTDHTLVIGAGGGKDIVLALLAGAQQITAVEVNPAVIDVTRHYADYNGGILDLPQVKLVEGDARSFVERTDARYDLIYLNLVYTQAAEPGSQVLVENYIFTWQAFKTYLEHLQPGGRIGIVAHNALEASRASVTVLRAFDEMGIVPAQALDHLMMWMLPSSDVTQRTSVLLVGKDAFSRDVIESASSAAIQLGMQGLFVPGDFEIAFQPLRNGESLERFIADDADYNLSPTSDDRPYFFHLDLGLPRPIQSALVTALFLAGGLGIFAFLMGGSEVKSGSLWTWGGMMLYAALIGTGFMLVEIPLIQHFQLLLGYPVLALVAVLGTLLLAGGVGSLISQRWPEVLLARRVMVAGLWIAALAVLYRLTLSAVLEVVLDQVLALRLLVVIGGTALLGLPMGIPFPSLMRLAGQVQQRVALLWAINGIFSALGSVLAVIISMSWGFNGALLIGALLYLALAVLARMMEFARRVPSRQ
jgi:hypothetical protein